MKRTLFALLGLSVWSQALVVLPAPAVGAEFSLKLRRVVEEPAGSGNLKRAYEQQSWNPAQTAVIICDTWDLHHCQNAVRRLEEFAPRINELAKRARAEGAVIIHARGFSRLRFAAKGQTNAWEFFAAFSAPTQAPPEHAGRLRRWLRFLPRRLAR